MLKKAVGILSILLGVSIIGCALCIPFGIRETMAQVNTMFKNQIIEAERIDIDDSVMTLRLNDYLGDIEFRQSDNDHAYIEVYNTTPNRYVSIHIKYLDDNTALLYGERVYGNKLLDRDTIEKEIVLELQNYPDAVIYLPKRISIEHEGYYYIGEHIEIANREEPLQEESDTIAEDELADETTGE